VEKKKGGRKLKGGDGGQSCFQGAPSAKDRSSEAREDENRTTQKVMVVKKRLGGEKTGGSVYGKKNEKGGEGEKKSGPIERPTGFLRRGSGNSRGGAWVSRWWQKRGETNGGVPWGEGRRDEVTSKPVDGGSPEGGGG